MESKKVIVQTIRRLKEIKAENSLTLSQIMDKMATKGYFVSESSLKRVFSPDSEKMSFRYQDTIAPIAEVLFGEYGDSSPSDDPAKLRQIIKDRDKTIENLMIKIEEMQKGSEQIGKMCTERRTLLESQIKQLTEEVEMLQAQIEKKDAMFEKLMRTFVLKGE